VLVGFDETEIYPGTCSHRECVSPNHSLRTIPNLITCGRTIACLALTAASVYGHQLLACVAALAVYWLGDILDGWVARATDRETAVGAVLDIACDRICILLVFLAYLSAGLTGHLASIWVFLTEFLIIDSILSLSFLAWPIRSPNYFYVVSRRAYLFNWSRPAKSLSSGLFIVLVAVDVHPALSMTVALGLLVSKTYWLVVVSRLPRLPIAGTSCAWELSRPHQG
jgi:Phosphatidylglycerophosphate synthase